MDEQDSAKGGELADANIVKWLDHTRTIDGIMWIAGKGKLPCNVLFIGEHPCRDDVTYGESFQGPPARLLYDKAKTYGFDMSSTYMTNVVKFLPLGKSLSIKDIKMCAPLLQAEIAAAKPKMIVTLGAKALAAVMGKGYKLSEYRGTVLPYGDPASGTQVFPMYSPSAILRDPDLDRDYNADWRMLIRLQQGSSTTLDKPDFGILHTVDEVRQFKDWFFANSKDHTLVLDCEWDGEHYMDNKGWIRTVQLGYAVGEAVIIELFDENAVCINQGDAVAIVAGPLKELLEDPRTKLIGHQLRADGEWLLSYNIDIRKNMHYDTIVAEHLINSVGPFGLEALTVKYTNMGRYDLDLMEWKEQNKPLCETGYGRVPSAILMPYGAADVDAPRRIMNEQLPKLQQFTKPRPPYPSLWDINMHTSVMLYELETTGLLVDKERLDVLTRMYRTRRDELEGMLLPMAENLGLKDFNFKSPPQRSKLLFDILQLTPIETTEGKSWDWVVNQPEDVQELLSPATSKETMAILADTPDAHPIIALLRDISKLDYVCRSWLTDPAEAENFNTRSKGGGLLAKIWPDGRIHARFSQLKETARFGSAGPNVQNWLKRAEGELKRIVGKELLEKHFGVGAKFPTLRSIIKPPPGWVLMEADWKQAEMFILAKLSRDQTMWSALNTPGKDLHDLTAISAFGLKVLGPDGNVVPEYVLLELAKSNKKEFEELQSKLVYLDQRGRRLTRKAFKDSLRVSAKNLNFGIPYGRGSQDIAIQVKAETGTTDSIHQLKAEIDQMMVSWKTETYVSAWQYMQECAGSVVDPGYLMNPWGRIRFFPKTYDEKLIRTLGREAQNYPIQSTVADTCLITLWLMRKYREQHNLHFKIVNQIHDAILVEVPEAEIDATKEMFYATMGNIDIPIEGSDPLRLDVDIDVMRRWGEK